MAVTTSRIRVVEYTEGGSMSAAEAMPTDEAAERAILHPVVGDQWTEMFSGWLHVDEVTETDVLLRLYIGPCEVRPSQASQSMRRARGDDFRKEVRHMSYNGNARWIADAAKDIR